MPYYLFIKFILGQRVHKKKSNDTFLFYDVFGFEVWIDPFPSSLPLNKKKSFDEDLFLGNWKQEPQAHYNALAHLLEAYNGIKALFFYCLSSLIFSENSFQLRRKVELHATHILIEFPPSFSFRE